MPGGVGGNGNCEMRCQPMPDLAGPMHANYLRLHNSAQGTERVREREREGETREYFVLRSYHSTRHVTRLGKRAHVTIARVKWNYANINVSLTTRPRVYSAFNAPQTTSEICPAAAPF